MIYRRPLFRGAILPTKRAPIRVAAAYILECRAWKIYPSLKLKGVPRVASHDNRFDQRVNPQVSMLMAAGALRREGTDGIRDSHRYYLATAPSARQYGCDNQEMTVSKELHTFEAVTFAFSPGRFRTIVSLEQVTGYLEHEWPAEAGPRCLRARKACKDAMTGGLSNEEARAEFIAALGEIGIPPDQKAEG
jgi:phosphate-selective porin